MPCSILNTPELQSISLNLLDEGGIYVLRMLSGALMWNSKKKSEDGLVLLGQALREALRNKDTTIKVLPGTEWKLMHGGKILSPEELGCGGKYAGNQNPRRCGNKRNPSATGFRMMLQR